MNYELLTTENVPVKMWTKGVPVEDDARQQLINTAKMPFIFKHIAVMPDVHLGKGSTIGSVIPTKGAIIPAAVGVDIGCGMNALRTALTAADLPENLAELRQAIETAVPHGRSNNRSRRDKGAWEHPPVNVDAKWAELEAGYQWLTQKYPRFLNTNNYKHRERWGRVTTLLKFALMSRIRCGLCCTPVHAELVMPSGLTLSIWRKKRCRKHLKRCHRVTWRTLWKVRNILTIT